MQGAFPCPPVDGFLLVRLILSDSAHARQRITDAALAIRCRAAFRVLCGSPANRTTPGTLPTVSVRWGALYDHSSGRSLRLFRRPQLLRPLPEPVPDAVHHLLQHIRFEHHHKRPIRWFP